MRYIAVFVALLVASAALAQDSKTGNVEYLRLAYFPDYPGDDDGCYAPRPGCFTIKGKLAEDGEFELTFDISAKASSAQSGRWSVPSGGNPATESTVRMLSTRGRLTQNCIGESIQATFAPTISAIDGPATGLSVQGSAATKSTGFRSTCSPRKD